MVFKVYCASQTREAAIISVVSWPFYFNVNGAGY